MREQEPRKETIGKGELYFLVHPGTEQTFSGYGLTARPGSKELLVGLLMVDRPHAVNPPWLTDVATTFSEYQLVPMTSSGERGIACQMKIKRESLSYLCQYPGEKAEMIQTALEPLLDHLPSPIFTLRWDEVARAWRSRFGSLVSPANR